MAAPPEITIKNLSGKYIMNKTLSDDPDSLLALQGIGWFTRKAISLATVILTIKEYNDSKSITHVDITSVASGLSTTQEDRMLDWTDREQDNKLFGKVRGKSQFRLLSDLSLTGPDHAEDLVFLKAETLKDLKTPSRYLGAEIVQSWVVNIDGKNWTAEQTWGFEEIGGKRYHTRRVVGRKGDHDVQRVRLVYDYKGAADDKRTAEDDDDDDGLAYGEDN